MKVTGLTGLTGFKRLKLFNTFKRKRGIQCGVQEQNSWRSSRDAPGAPSAPSALVGAAKHSDDQVECVVADLLSCTGEQTAKSSRIRPVIGQDVFGTRQDEREQEDEEKDQTYRQDQLDDCLDDDCLDDDCLDDDCLELKGVEVRRAGAYPSLEYLLFRATRPRRPDTMVVVIPGAAHQARLYARFARATAAAGVSVVVLNLRGHGGSGLPPNQPLKEVRLAHYIADVATVIADLQRCEGRNAARIVLVGHSLGSFIAFGYAERHAVASVVALDGPAPHLWMPIYLRTLLWLAAPSRRAALSTLLNPAAMFATPALRACLLLSSDTHLEYATPCALAELERWLLPEESRAIARDLRAAARSGPRPLQTARVTFLSGDADWFVSRICLTRSAQAYQGSTVWLIPGPHNLMQSGHWQAAAAALAQIAVSDTADTADTADVVALDVAEGDSRHAAGAGSYETVYDGASEGDFGSEEVSASAVADAWQRAGGAGTSASGASRGSRGSREEMNWMEDGGLSGLGMAASDEDKGENKGEDKGEESSEELLVGPLPCLNRTVDMENGGAAIAAINERNEATVWKFYAAMNANDLSRAATYLHADFEEAMRGVPDSLRHGRESFLYLRQLTRGALDAVHIRVLRLWGFVAPAPTPLMGLGTGAAANQDGAGCDLPPVPSRAEDSDLDALACAGLRDAADARDVPEVPPVQGDHRQGDHRQGDHRQEREQHEEREEYVLAWVVIEAHHTGKMPYKGIKRAGNFSMPALSLMRMQDGLIRWHIEEQGIEQLMRDLRVGFMPLHASSGQS